MGGVRRRVLVGLGLALAASALCGTAARLGALATLQARAADLLFGAHGDERARATVIVAIDQRSHRELAARFGPMVEWSRTLYAEALDRLAAARPRVVVFDLFFDAPQPEDVVLAAAMRRAGAVVLPVEAQGPGRLTPAPGVAQEFDLFARLPRTLRAAAAAEGFTNLATDRDGVVRGLPLVLRAGGEDLAALALVAAARYVRRPAALDHPPDATHVYGAGRAIPLVAGGRMLVNFLGAARRDPDAGPVPVVPFADVLSGAFDPARVQDRLVLVGLTIRGLDEFATPVGGPTRMWGVELLAHAIETILQDRYLVAASGAVTLAALGGLALAAAVLVALCRPLWAALGALGLLAGYLAGAAVAFDQGVLANLVYPPLALVLAFAGATVHRVVFEEAQQRRLRETMARYLSPAVSQWVLREPARLRLGGETRIMTVLFSDLRGFTTLSAGLDPQALVALLNEYMTAMTEVVFRHDGVLDKYIGDAIMAFWGAPLDQPDHARRACQTALDMAARLGALRAEWARRGLPPLDCGVGINTGPMVVGNMGSRVRLAYTVIGDAVNVASRLEGLSKAYGTRVVVSEATRDAAGGAFEYRFLDVVAVKGRPAPLAVFEVLAPSGALEPARRAWLARYQAAVEGYRNRRFAEAAALFRALHAEDPADGPARLYLERSEACLADPPPADWDGVFVARSK
jgi:adenylate cyclase